VGRHRARDLPILSRIFFVCYQTAGARARRTGVRVPIPDLIFFLNLSTTLVAARGRQSDARASASSRSRASNANRQRDRTHASSRRASSRARSGRRGNARGGGRARNGVVDIIARQRAPVVVASNLAPSTPPGCRAR
jgi:hypothetical protein